MRYSFNFCLCRNCLYVPLWTKGLAFIRNFGTRFNWNCWASEGVRVSETTIRVTTFHQSVSIDQAIPQVSANQGSTFS